jgi:hypothetical protein
MPIKGPKEMRRVDIRSSNRIYFGAHASNVLSGQYEIRYHCWDLLYPIILMCCMGLLQPLCTDDDTAPEPDLCLAPLYGVS